MLLNASQDSAMEHLVGFFHATEDLAALFRATQDYARCLEVSEGF